MLQQERASPFDQNGRDASRKKEYAKHLIYIENFVLICSVITIQSR